MKAALIGRKYWGEILTPYIYEKFDLISVTGGNDTNIKKLAKDVDVFFIATPLKTHYKLAKQCLKLKKHVFIEKAITYNPKHAKKLKKIAEKNNVIIYTDYTEMCSPSRIDLSKYVNNFFKITFNTEKIINNYNDSSIIWKLSSHQLSMFSLFDDLNNYNFEILYTNKYAFIWCYHKYKLGKRIIMSVKGCSKKSKKTIDIYKKNGTSIFYDFYSPKTIVIENEKIIAVKSYDEKNNLKFSIQKFINIINNKEKNNIDVAIKITDILYNLEKKGFYK